MKYLSDYTQEAQTNLFEATGSFFAFSDIQMDRGKKEGVHYVSLGSGLITPKANVKKLIDGMQEIQKKGILKDIKENGIIGIIKRELANYEAQITMSIDDTVEALEEYPDIDEKIIQIVWPEFWADCIKNNDF